MENKSAPKEPSLDTTYNPTEIEQPLYQHWEKMATLKPMVIHPKKAFVL